MKRRRKRATVEPSQASTTASQRKIVPMALSEALERVDQLFERGDWAQIQKAKRFLEEMEEGLTRE